MIKRIQIQNYKALRDVTLDLTPIHLLIGPNDSGKTSIMEAIGALCRSVDHPLAQAFAGAWFGRQLIWQGKPELNISLTASLVHQQKEIDYSLTIACVPNRREMTNVSEYVRTDLESSPTQIELKTHKHSRVNYVFFQGQPAPNNLRDVIGPIYDSLLGVQSYHWDGRFLALPVAPDSKRRFRMESSGFGLALCLDDILGYDRDRFIALEKRFRRVFPDIKSIKLVPESAYKSPVDDPEQIPLLNKSDGKGIYFEFVSGGELIPARQVSDGILLVLAYLTVLNLPEPPRVVLIEEPENGIHPKRLKDVLTILRDLISEQSHTQVVLTTHSPYVVDLFQPQEVTLCQKGEDGSITVRRLSESKAVSEQLDVFTLGEIWTAEGDESLAEAFASDGESGG